MRGDFLIHGRIQSTQADDDDLRLRIPPGVNAGAAVRTEEAVVGRLVTELAEDILSPHDPEAGARNARDCLVRRAGRFPADRAMAKHDRPQRVVDLVLDLAAKTTASVHGACLPIRNTTC